LRKLDFQSTRSSLDLGETAAPPRALPELHCGGSADISQSEVLADAVLYFTVKFMGGLGRAAADAEESL
jgi:hypothetical protein